MKTVYEAGRDLPVAGEFDVVVAGSGPSGACAAITAARLLLLECSNAVGGMSTFWS